MIENTNPNTFTSPDKRRRARFSLPTNDRSKVFGRRVSMNSLLNPKENNSPINSPLNSSSDAEWATFQAALNTAKNQGQDFDDSDCSFEEEVDEDNKYLRKLDSVSPNKKRLSIGTINTARNEIALMKRDLEIESEMQALDKEVADMEEAFRTMYAEITQQRVNIERNTNDNVVYDMIMNLDLTNIDPMLWAPTMEKIANNYSV